MTALRLDFAFPAADRGPVDFFALRRFASILFGDVSFFVMAITPFKWISDFGLRIFRISDCRIQTDVSGTLPFSSALSLSKSDSLFLVPSSLFPLPLSLLPLHASRSFRARTLHYHYLPGDRLNCERASIKCTAGLDPPANVSTRMRLFQRRDRQGAFS